MNDAASFRAFLTARVYPRATLAILLSCSRESGRVSEVPPSSRMSDDGRPRQVIVDESVERSRKENPSVFPVTSTAGAGPASLAQCLTTVPRGRRHEHDLSQQDILSWRSPGRRVRLAGELSHTPSSGNAVMVLSEDGISGLLVEISPVPTQIAGCAGRACVEIEGEVTFAPHPEWTADAVAIELHDPVFVARLDDCPEMKTSAPLVVEGPPFDRDAALRSLRSIASDLQDCAMRGGPVGDGHVSVTFEPDGTVSVARIDAPPYLGTAAGGCIASKFRKARVPSFGGTPITLRKTFVLQ